MRLMRLCVAAICVVSFILSPSFVLAWTAGDIAQDPLLRMPGTQPNELSFPLTGPEKLDNGGVGCLNCHGETPVIGPNTVTPGYPWMGSMMGQAARDPIFWATMTVAMQDSVWALGNADAGDLCLRCHFPEGWLAGRSGHTDPADLNASAMTASDYDGVHCDVCHMQMNPFFEDSMNGTRDAGTLWDEVANPANPTQFTTVIGSTWGEDRVQAPGFELFNHGFGGLGFYVDAGNSNFYPKYATYTENGGGQFFISNTPGAQVPLGHAAKRGPFINAITDNLADHQNPLYSRYHKSKFFCSTCHDVSNPVLANLPALNTLPDQSNGDDLITEQYSAHRFGHVERTFSEFMLSAYAQPGGAATNAEYAAGNNTANIPGVTAVSNAEKCQDCHMADVAGGIPAGGSTPRPTAEHPNSGSPAHDFQGGNAWMSRILGSIDYNGLGTTWDPVNYQILTGDNPVTRANPTANVATHTLDVEQGVGLLVGDYDIAGALNNAADRAEYQLGLAATLKDVQYDSDTGILKFKVQNNTGHKLISGYPEGRRMFLNIEAFDAGMTKIYEVNPYDAAAGTMKGLPFTYSDPDTPALPDPAPLSGTEEYIDRLVYEMHQSSALTEETKTFHFVLGTDRKKDNRIPPKGFDIASADDRLIEPVWNGVVDSAFFTAAEYAGGYDEVTVQMPAGAAQVDVNLYYQGTSREYVEFLRDEINGVGNMTLYGPDNGNVPTYASANGLNGDGDDAYLIQSDQFFAGLSGWGTTMWDLWKHNSGLGTTPPTQVAQGLTPFLMATATASPATVAGVTVVTPNGGEEFHAGDQAMISWMGVDNAADYLVQYHNGPGSVAIDIATVTSGTSTTWTVPDPSVKPPTPKSLAIDDGRNSNVQIRVTARDDVGTTIDTDDSDAAFTIFPNAVHVVAPVAGATLVSEATTTLDWSGADTVGSYKLKYSLDAGASWNDIQTINAPTESLSWTVPKVASAATQSLFKVVAYAGADATGTKLYAAVSDAFTITPVPVAVTSPNGTETMASKDVVTVTWTAATKAKSYQLLYSTDNMTTFTSIATLGKVTSYDWTLPKVTAAMAQSFIKVKAFDRAGKKLSIDVSDAAFTINPALVVTTPAVDAILRFGDLVSIAWTLNTTSPAVATIDVQYRKKSDKPWEDIAIGLAKTATTQDWTVPTFNKDKTDAAVRVVLRDALGNKINQVKVPIQLLSAPN